MADTHNLYLQGIEESTTQFLEIWHHYDNAGRGYIEGNELQNFIRELQQARKGTGLELSDGMKALVEKYDQSADGKIELADLVQILPTEENFFLFFRQQLKSSTEFMEATLQPGAVKMADFLVMLGVGTVKTWRRYDEDHSGFIEADELKSFLRDLLKKANRPFDEVKLEEYTLTTLTKVEIAFLVNFALMEDSGGAETDSDHLSAVNAHLQLIIYNDAAIRKILKNRTNTGNWEKLTDCGICKGKSKLLKMFDSNHDGKLGLGEMARLLPDKENFLLKFQGVNLSSKEFNDIFDYYDQDGNGYIDENELDALLKDLCEKNKKDLDIQNLTTYKKSIMVLSDGGKLFRKDLALILCAEEF